MSSNPKSTTRIGGKEHGGNTPNLPVIREKPLPERERVMIGLQPGTRYYRMGRATILLSPPFPEMDMGWHMSISRPDRYPSWDEIAKARYELIPNETEMVMHLPPRGDYVNLHNFCFHIHELISPSPFTGRGSGGWVDSPLR